MRWPLALGLFFLTLATRLPFATEHLWAHDSVLYARAVEDFDPAAHRPQPPGYIYYVYLIRALAFFTGDANGAMTLLSALAAAVAVALLYAFAARLYGEDTGRAAALLLLTSATFWGYGAVAYPYTLLAALTTACAWLFWRVLTLPRDGTRRLLAASAAWGIAIGFRLDLLVYLAPLWVLAALAAGRVAAVAAAAMISALLIVYVALTALAADGLGPFLQAMTVQGEYVSEQHGVARNGLAGLVANAYEVTRSLARTLYVTLVPLALAVVWGPARHAVREDHARLRFVALWAAAPLPIYLLLHIGDLGYAFSMLPALCVLAARVLTARQVLSRTVRLGRAALAGLVLANAVIFLFADAPASATELKRRDKGVAEKLAYIDRLGERHEVIVIAGHDRAVVHHYGGGHRHRMVGYDPLGQGERLADRYRELRGSRERLTVVVWDDGTRVRGPEWQVVRLRHGALLRAAEVSPARDLRVAAPNVLEFQAAR